MAVRNGVRIANELRKDTLPPEWIKRIEDRVLALYNTRNSLMAGNINIVFFHVNIPPDAGKVTAPDIINLDHNSIDYETLIEFNIKSALRTNPRSRVFLLTDQYFLRDLSEHPRLSIIRLPLNSKEPMFERVATMLAFVRSNLFDCPSVFLDSDAFTLSSLSHLFANDFDIALTHRNIYGQMPLNEGVIFANNIDRKRVVMFFESYLASYLSLEKSTELAEIYSNLRRWRGGQLSLNAAGSGGQVYSTGLGSSTPSAPRIAILPCSQYNLSEISEDEVDAHLRTRALILHLKGLRKSWIKKLEAVLFD